MSISKCTLQFVVRYGNRITRGNTPVGVLPHGTWRCISKHCPQMSGIILCILAKDSINVCQNINRFPCHSYILNYNTRSTQKSLVRQRHAWFDTKNPGSTQKCPVRHKKCPPQHASVDIAPPPPPVRNVFFFQLHSNVLFLITHREMKMELYWYEFKYIGYHCENWNAIILFCLWWP